MSSVEILQSTSSIQLENKLNIILEETEVADVKYSIAFLDDGILYSAMVIYK